MEDHKITIILVEISEETYQMLDDICHDCAQTKNTMIKNLIENEWNKIHKNVEKP